jgi:predicted nucleotidyltransferase component of viral defense system
MTKREIENIALEKSVSNATIDKDWVLGHFLNAFYSFENNKNNFVFKGGTCLRKCYFEDYRFSDDLDFTLLRADFRIDSQFIHKIIKLAEKNSDIKFHLSEINHQMHDDIQQGYEIKIKFWGADHKPNSPILPPSRWQTSIKLDISFTEQVNNKPNYCKIIHPYADSYLISEIIPAYAINEIIAEKLRALIQRNRPRDIYDIWYIMNSNIEIDRSAIKELLLVKAENKNIEIISADQFVNPIKQRKIKRAWINSLGQHLPLNALPEFDFVYKDLFQIVSHILNY